MTTEERITALERMLKVTIEQVNDLSRRISNHAIKHREIIMYNDPTIKLIHWDTILED